MFLAHPLLGILGLIIWGICGTVTWRIDADDRRYQQARFEKQQREEQETREKFHYLEYHEHSELYRGENPEWYAWVDRERCELKRANAEHSERMLQEARLWEAEREAETERQRAEVNERMRQLYAPVQAHIDAAERAERRAEEIYRRLEEAKEIAAKKAMVEAAERAKLIVERVQADEERVGRARTAREAREAQKTARKAVKRAWRGIPAT